MTATPRGIPLDSLRNGSSAAVLPTRGRWQAWALGVICLGAGALYVWGIGSGSFGNPFYAAAVKSMSRSFTNFLFGSFDPAGVITVDKPPMSLWPQVFATWIFGYHGWAVLLPQVLEGMGTVLLLHRTVRRWAGDNVALLAALILAVTPITVAINRDNNPDTLLILLLVAAAYAFTRSIGTDSSHRRTSWLLWCAFFIGCGFVTKMLEAWIIVPGLALAFLTSDTRPMKRRILDLLGAAVVLIVSSFWWSALHDWWPGPKPYMGGSTNGTAWNLIFGYNGFGRIFGEGDALGHAPASPELKLPPGLSAMFGGNAGISRMFSAVVGGQISWLLPLALIVLVVVAVAGARRWRAHQPGEPRHRAGWMLWGSWLIVTGLVFSYAHGIWHPYYTTMLAPAIAAISAAGIALLWRYYRDGGIAWVLLPVAIAVTAVWSFILTSRDASWNGWTRWVTLAMAIVAIGGLLAGRRAPRQHAARPALIAAMAMMLLTPTVWSTATALGNARNGVMPTAGPSMQFGFPGMPKPPAGAMPPGLFGGAPSLTAQQRKILDYAQRNSVGDAITLAVEGGAMASSTYIITSNATVIGMGGFLGTDNAPSISQLQQWTNAGKLKYILDSAPPSPGHPAAGSPSRFGISTAAVQQRTTWVQAHCRVVNPTAYGEPATSQSAPVLPVPAFRDQTLYDCAPR